MVKRFFIFFFPLLLSSSLILAQDNTDEELAAQYYQNKEYEKAVVLYEKLFSKSAEYQYYLPYLDCLIQTKDFQKAEKVVKKQVKIHALIPQYGVDLGYLYSVEGETKLSTAQYDAMIKGMQDEKQYVIDLANAFLLRDQTDYAIQTYLKARKISKLAYTFNLELADIYEGQKQYEKMMDEYVSLLESNDYYTEEIKNELQSQLADDPDLKKSAALKNVLLKRVQDYPGKDFYAEMLLWYSIQVKDFDVALIQAKSLDRRNKEEGKRVFDVARLAVSNEYYDVAISAYQYVIDKGSENYYYLNSRLEIMDAKFSKITSTALYTTAELNSLEADYKSALTDLGKNVSTISLMKNLAHLQAFYLDKSAEAIKLLYETLDLTNAQPSVLAECKIELADILLMTGDVWEATLLYSQVDKAFKDEPIGHLAKFKNAKLSFYIGEFAWAKAQLDILKAATSKLIANDAMELSLLISDNISTDSSYDALAMYARADLLQFRNKLDDALLVLDSFPAKFPSHSLADEVLYKKAKIFVLKGLYDSAVVYYKAIIEGYSYDILGDDAIFDLAKLYEEKYKDKALAMKYYEKLITEFPGSIYTIEARKRYRTLRGDTLK